VSPACTLQAEWTSELPSQTRSLFSQTVVEYEAPELLPLSWQAGW